MNATDEKDLPPLPQLALGRWRHYKGGEYEVVGVARHSESLAPLVVYRPLYKASGWWVRPHAMFVEEVLIDGRLQPRFAPIDGDGTPAAQTAEADALLATLARLEAELHHPGTRCSAERLEALLHPAFHEVGRSGRAYTRQTVQDFLLGQTPSPQVVAWAYAVQPLGPDAALLCYQSAHRCAEGTPLIHHTLRSSLWRLGARGWQLFYHQGTPAAEQG